MEELVARRQKLMHRLVDGQEKIEAARRQGRPPEVIHNAEQRWISLLGEYEEIEDLIHILRAEQQ